MHLREDLFPLALSENRGKTLQYKFGFSACAPQDARRTRFYCLVIYRDELYITDNCNSRIQVCSLGGVFRRSIGYFRGICGIAFCKDLMIVSQFGNTGTDQNKLQVLSLSGMPLQVSPLPHVDPRGIAISGEHLYVTDMLNNKVHVARFAPRPQLQ